MLADLVHAASLLDRAESPANFLTSGPSNQQP
jgi:hypothetical protein